MLKSFTPSQVHVEAAETVFKAMAWVETVRPVVEGYQKRIMTDLGWGHLAPHESYLLPNHVFDVYLKRCFAARDAAGLKVDKPDHCPLLVAAHMLTKAHRVLVDIMEPVTDISFDQIMCSPHALENLDKYVDLTLRLLAPYCRTRIDRQGRSAS